MHRYRFVLPMGINDALHIDEESDKYMWQTIIAKEIHWEHCWGPSWWRQPEDPGFFYLMSSCIWHRKHKMLQGIPTDSMVFSSFESSEIIQVAFLVFESYDIVPIAFLEGALDGLLLSRDNHWTSFIILHHRKNYTGTSEYPLALSEPCKIK
jgi:hypothetical protein